jgi:hypothetical protein
MAHKHDVYHFTGSIVQLNEISKVVFGISLDEVSSAF